LEVARRRHQRRQFAPRDFQHGPSSISSLWDLIVPTEVRGALEKILDHYMPAEAKHHSESEPSNNHIFGSLLVVRQWLDSPPIKQPGRQAQTNTSRPAE
jgi:hypothetical protein